MPVESLKPIPFDSKLVKPLPSSLHGMSCTNCSKPHASWSLRAVEDVAESAVCSRCVLYDSRWGEEQENNLARFVAAVEANLGTTFEKDANMRLSRREDADRVLGAIVMENMVYSLRSRAGGV